MYSSPIPPITGNIQIQCSGICSGHASVSVSTKSLHLAAQVATSRRDVVCTVTPFVLVRMQNNTESTTCIRKYLHWGCLVDPASPPGKHFYTVEVRVQLVQLYFL